MAPLSKVPIGMEPPFHRIFESRVFFGRGVRMRNYAIQIHPRTKLQFASFAQNHPTNQPTWVRPIFSYRVFLFKSFVKLTPGSTKARFVSCCCRQRTCDDVRQYAEADHIIKNVMEMSELEKFVKGVSDWL